MLKRCPRFVAILAVLVEIALGACSVTDSRPSTVSDYLEQKMNSEASGAMALGSFEKTNGYDQQAQGLQMYVLEWQARISARSDFWKGGNAIMGYWQDFGAQLQRPSGFMATGKRFKKGSVVRLTGDALLLKTERGWRVEQFNVKTSQLLDAGPKSPFDGVWSDPKTTHGKTWVTLREEESGTFKFGESAFGPITDDGDFVARLDVDGESLAGTFESTNFRPTHGVAFPYTIRMSLGTDGTLAYSESGPVSCQCTKQLTRTQ